MFIFNFLRLIFTFAFPTAIIILPQLGSSPAIAVFTNGEFAIEKQIFFASFSVLHFSVFTITNLDDPSPSAATFLAKFFKTLFAVLTASFFTFTLQSADLNIATLDPQAALFSTNVAKKELEELENSDEWKEVVEELQAKATEAREIQERTQKDGPTMSDEEKQEAAQKFQSLQQDINFLR